MDVYVINFCRLKRRVIRQMYMNTLGKFSVSGRTGTVQNAEDETKPLLSGELWFCAGQIVYCMDIL